MNTSILDASCKAKPPSAPKELIQHVVFNRERPAVPTLVQTNHRAERLAGNTRHADKIEIVILLDRYADRRQDQIHDLRVGVLHEDQVRLARFADGARKTLLMQQRVDIAMAVGLEQQRIRILQRQMRLTVGDRGNKVLLEDAHL